MCQKRISTLSHPVLFALCIIIIIILSLTHKRLSAAHVSLLMSYPASFVHPSCPPTPTHTNTGASQQRGTLISRFLFLNVNTQYGGGVCVCVCVCVWACLLVRVCSVGGVHICEWARLLHPTLQHKHTLIPAHTHTHTHTHTHLQIYLN